MGCSVVTGVKLITDVGVLVIKDAVGSGALGVDAGLGFLLEFPRLAVYVVGQDTFFAVSNGVVKQESVGAEVGFGHVVLADVVQVALLGVGEETVLF